MKGKIKKELQGYMFVVGGGKKLVEFGQQTLMVIKVGLWENGG